MDELTINTIYYEKVHGAEPVWNKRGDWTFQPPPNYGRRPWLFVDVKYNEAKKELEQRAKWGGEFFLLP